MGACVCACMSACVSPGAGPNTVSCGQIYSCLDIQLFKVVGVVTRPTPKRAIIAVDLCVSQLSGIAFAG